MPDHGEILGLGISHWAAARPKERALSYWLRRTLEDPDITPAEKDPKKLAGADARNGATTKGTSHAQDTATPWPADYAKSARRSMRSSPTRSSSGGDDQYENFREDIVPAFSVLAYQAISSANRGARWPTSGTRRKDTTFNVKKRAGNPKYLATGMIEEEFDVAYGLPAAALSAICRTRS